MEANNFNKHKQEEYEQIALQPPTTPKKKPKYSLKEPSTTRRIKSFTQTKEKQSNSPIYALLVFIWVIAFAFMVHLAFQTKLKNAEVNAEKDINQCKIDFELNKCQSPVKRLIEYCNQKITCMNQLAFQKVDRSISYPGILGQVLSEFAHGLGLIGLFVGLCLIGMCLRQKGRQKQTVTLQFFE